MNLRALILPVFLFAAIAAHAGSYDFKESVTRTGAFADSGTFTLENVNGKVDIRTWDKNEILVEAEKSAATDEELKLIELTIELTADSAAIKVRLPKRAGGIFSGNTNIRAAVNFKVTVPATTTLEKVSVVNSSVTLDGLRAPVNISSVNGGLHATRLGGDAKLSTVNGTIKADFTDVTAAQKLSFKSVNGRLVVGLPKDAGFELKSSVVNGSIKCEFPLELGEKKGRSLSGKIGDGRASLDARTVNGGISIEQL